MVSFFQKSPDAFRVLEQAAADARIRFMMFGETRPNGNACLDGDSRFATAEEVHRACLSDEGAPRPADPRPLTFRDPRRLTFKD